MKLKEFSVKNFRSITEANKIKLDDFTVLVGKNNEGKSNLLKALNIAMSILTDKMYAHRYSKDDGMYNWENDIPKQINSPEWWLTTEFSMKFELKKNELEELYKETKIHEDSEIVVLIRIGKSNTPYITVHKGDSTSCEKQHLVIEFLRKKLKFSHIQAVRTEDTAKHILSYLIDTKLDELESNHEYIKAQKRIQELKDQSLKEITSKLIEPIKVFLPDVKDLKIELQKKDDFFSRHNPFDIIIDDGVATSISAKGEGIKSVFSLALLQQIKFKHGLSVITIEEPETHLHSGAIHDLVDAINKLSINNQVVITTHNPLFVCRNHLNSNIIVDSGQAKVAKTIEEIRNILGVWTSDNLTNAKYVFFVEGEDDKISLMKILPTMSKKIGSALKNGTMIIKPLHGASNLSHDVNDAKCSLCQCCALLDDDEAGRAAAEKAFSGNIISNQDVKFTKCPGSSEAEFEDCIQMNVYAQEILDKYSVNLVKSRFFKGKEKWSTRMGKAFSEFGSVWNDKVKEDVKMCVANSLPAKIKDKDDVLIPQKSSFLEGVAIMIEKMIGSD